MVAAVSLKQYNSTIANLDWKVPEKFEYGAHQKLNAWIFEIW